MGLEAPGHRPKAAHFRAVQIDRVCARDGFPIYHGLHDTCYTNPLHWHGAEHRRLSHDTPERWFTHSCYCCPPQVARTIARLHRWAYGLADDAVWVHLYGGSRLQTEVAGGALVLTQETDYPWDGTIVITLREAPAEPFTLHLRVPGWAQGAELEVAGAPVAAAPGTYVPVRRQWQAGDRVTLTLPLHAELVTANPRLEQDRNQAAVVRGPVVYCLEAVDVSAGSERDQTGARSLPAERRHHPHGTPLDEIHLPRDFAPAAHYEPDLLGGVAVLEGTAIQAKARPWARELYRRGEAADRVPVPIRMIPYFAWHNRGNHAMAVWLPLA